MVDVERHREQLCASRVLTALLNEFSAVTDYHTLQDSLPRRLAGFLKCHCVLFYQRVGETLQFVAGSFEDMPGWSASLLAIAHINPVDLNSDVPEACAWRERHCIVVPATRPTLVAAPLIYRQRGIGVLVAIRSKDEAKPHAFHCWSTDDVEILEAIAGVVALLLENTRLLERDRERIHELSLLNSISSQMNCSMYELDRLRHVIIQRTKEISATDLCELLESEEDTVSWITPTLRKGLFQHFHEQRSPLIIERPGNPENTLAHEYLSQLPTTIKTFFAIPLLNGRRVGRRGSSLLRGSLGTAQELNREPKVLGIVVGAYHRAWKLRRTETVLLQVLASQASAVMENIHLMAEVVEARNEARKLLRQVLDDQRLKALILESIPSGLITTDRSGCITTFNRAASAILGYHPYEVVRHPLHKFLDLRISSAKMMQESASSCTSSQPYRVLRTAHMLEDIQGGTVVTLDRHGHEVVLDVDVLPLCDDLGEQIGILATFIDVTSVHRLEEEKRRLDRLASLGEMAANVAHEVRNPLASIKTSMQMLMDDLVSNGQEMDDEEQSGWAQESITVVLKEVERLDSIVRDLLLFAKPRQLHRTRCDLVALSDRVLQFMQPQCAEANVVVHRVYEAVPALWVDVSQIEQVLLNLYMNALQAMPDGGILTVVCQALSQPCVVPGEHSSDGASCHVLDSGSYFTSVQHSAASVSQWMEIAVSDTGVGIPSEQLGRIFQPFFTTKAHGIGLGLAIIRRLVEDHGGYICVEGHFGYGATFSIRLPLMIEDDSDQEKDDTPDTF